MGVSRFAALFVVLFLRWWELVSAHSSPVRPLKSLAHPSTLALEILPRRLHPRDKRQSSQTLRSSVLRHSDSFRLIVSAFDDVFHLHLRPNEHLVHPAARVSYYHTTPEGKTVPSHTEPLLRESVKAYWGEVVPAELSSSRMRVDAARVLSPQKSSDLGWARIMVHHQGDIGQAVSPLFEGAFSVNGVVHHVMTKDNYLRNKLPRDPNIFHPFDGADSSLVIWRESDVMSVSEEQIARTTGIDIGLRPPPPQICGHDSLTYNTDPARNSVLQKPPSPDLPSWYDSLGVFSKFSFSKRDDVVGTGVGSTFVDSIGNTNGCSKTPKVIYMGVAADCQYTGQYGSTQNATTQILSNWNTASSLYKTTFNVSLGIIELQIQNSTCPRPADPNFPWNIDCASSNLTLNERLSLFSAWRGQKGDDGAGLWHLMSGCPTGTEVGIAWLGTLCQQTASGSDPSVVSGTAVSTAGRTEWQVIAHEIGHNFGAIHDCADGCDSTTSCCPLSTISCDANAKYLMSPVAETGEMNFSPCSVGNICSLMQGISGGQTNTTCLLDPNQDTKTITLQMCGNGIVEQGEDCDPGHGVTSPCCDSATCKFLPAAMCDPESTPCCTDQCSFAPSSQVCRPSQDPTCDMAEMCTGNLSSCPPDRTAPNGVSCGAGGLACAGGHCTSLSQQCQSAGSSLGLQVACPSDNCQVSCQDPTQSNTCVQLQSNLIDGSSCGYGGTCASGTCRPGGLLDIAKAWYTQNLQLSIPATVIAGIIVVLLLWGMVSGFGPCCCRGSRERKQDMLDPALVGVRHRRLQSFNEVSVAPVRAIPGPPALAMGQA